MFTGIVQGRGRVAGKEPAGGGMVLRLEADFDLADPEEGESIAVNGVCLTARNIRGDSFLVDVSPETLSRTGLGALRPGSLVNLERALRLSDRLGGHLVSGHVDGLGRVEERRAVGDFTLFTFSLSRSLTKYVIEKGSIAINGVSLTVNSCAGERFTVSIIPHTLEMTTLGELKPGDLVNIEVDIIGKYVEKLLMDKSAGAETGSGGRINAAFLAEHGFLK
ncbi:MAG TPA: riboflavin synthase [Desulfobacteraceae bacterium]|nr:riboflavin synthase [Desulfobacteraceae bacterium]